MAKRGNPYHRPAGDERGGEFTNKGNAAKIERGLNNSIENASADKVTIRGAFKPEQIEELRARYGAIDRVDPGGKGYAGIRASLDKLDQPSLKMLAGADIKWISSLARNRIK